MRSMTKQGSESGVVSLMVTLVMMIVITLVVLGFAEIARNEQRNSLDDQLSAQAYYAAESGINDIRTIMKAAVAAGTAVQDKTVCGNQGSYTLNGTIDAAHNVEYTCILVDATPSTLTYNLGSTSTVIPLLSNGPAFGSITLNWNVASGYAATAAGCYTNLGSLHQNPVAIGTGQWNCNYPMLRIDLLDANGALARPNWANATTTAFLVPFNSGSVTNTFNLGVHGSAIPARCNATNCSISISSLGGTKYYMRVTALYRANSILNISAGGTKFTGAQATIDATGKAQDVLRRVVVGVDLTDANAHPIPTGAIVTRDSICKRFGITNGSFNVYDDLSAGGGGNVYCTFQSIGTPIP